MVHFEIPELKSYRGNKGVQGLYQFIINQIPPHEKYYELFLGSGSILRHKLPSAVTVGIDLDQNVIDPWKKHAPNWVSVKRANALQYLSTLLQADKKTFIYLDPPYLPASIRSGTAVYNCTLSRSEHEKLLTLSCSVKCYCMISAYDNSIYNLFLHGWRKKKFKVCVHGKTVEETIYMNYPEPSSLHDYQYLGFDCWDRQRIKRKIKWKIDTLKKLPILEQKAILQALNKSHS